MKNFSSKDSKKFYKEILESINDAIIVVSNEKKILEFNQAAEKICNTSSKIAMESSIDDFFSYNPALKTLINESIHSEKSYINSDFEFFQRKNLTHIPLNIEISSIYDNHGKSKGVVITLRDISIVKELKENISRNERLSVMGTIASTMAHEIKNPLSGIKGASQLLRAEIKDNDHLEYINVILKETERLNKILSGLLFLSRPKKPKFEETNIHKILSEILLLQAQTDIGKKTVIKTIFDPSIPFIWADVSQIFQVLLNIIKNSLESMKNGGEMFLTTKIILDYHIQLKDSMKQSKLLLIEVKDSGCGISEKHLNDIFTPFYSTKKESSGLGLTISNSIIKAHNGKIIISNNEKENGTTVKLYLPIDKFSFKGIKQNE